MLRHSDSRLPAAVKHRYHGILSQRVPELTLPTPNEEAASPEAADEAYEAASKWLLEQTRDPTRFRLLFAENINYGFRRNLLAAKPFGVVADVLAVLLIIGLAIMQSEGDLVTLASQADFWSLGGAAIAALHLLWLTVVVTPNWVRMTAERYAEQLLAACDVL
ncbi:hypothetical protein DEM34_17765 [Spiribacter halobius]|uniref:Uncharacterized protein n=2 Tax=Sediminicurvatus halobius TaxID=2182432 RepID=A0A2U2MWE8_9GAMM|nr:hypothetical protein DEM34_17765 [Spiribacter halobius]